MKWKGSKLHKGKLKYAKLLLHFWSTSTLKEMEYRSNFLFSALLSLGNTLGGLFALSFFYRPGAQLGGWSWNEAVVILGVFTVVEGISQSLLIPNLNRIVDHVQMGTLDFVLLKPVDSQFWLSFRQFSLWGVPSILAGLALIFYGIPTLKWNVLLGFFTLFVGLFILYSLWFMLATLSVWFVKIYNVTAVLKAVVEGGRYPMSAYPTMYRIFMTFIVPVAFLTTVPSEAFLGKAKVIYITSGVVFATLLFLLSRWFWKLALRYYTSASS